MKPERDYRSYFGSPDESNDSLTDAKSKHITLSVENQLKIADKGSGDQIVVAPKGFGKTNLRMSIQADAEQSIMSIFSENDQKFSFKASEVQGGSGVGKDAIAVVLLSSLVGKIAESGGFKEQSFKKFRELLDNIGVVLQDTEINFVANVPIGKIFSGARSGFEGSKLDSMIDIVISQLKEQRAYILIDDIDDVFMGAFNHPIAIEALCRAISYLNSKCRDKVHIVGFMKRGLYKKLYENRTDFDKIGGVFSDISWDKGRLAEFVASRIKYFNNDKAKDAEKKSELDLWKEEFALTNKDEFDELINFVWTITRSSPRDVIQLLNLAKKHAGTDKIRITDIKTALPDFSSDKFQNMKSEYNNVFPGVFDFAKKILSSKEQTWEFDKIEKAVREVVEDSNALTKSIKNENWFDERDNVERIQLLFDVGVLGKVINGQSFFIGDVPLDEATSVEHCQLTVHPALCPFFKIK